VALADPIAADSERWATEGVITAEQAASIRERYAQAVSARLGLRAVQALAILGAFVFGFGVILFFSANWSEIPRFIRLLILLAAIAGFYLGGYFLRERSKRYRELGHAFLVVGNVFFGASLFLVDQMYNIQAGSVRSFLYWAAAALVTGILLRSRPLATIAVITFGAFILGTLALHEEQLQNGAEYIPVLAVMYGTALYGIGEGARRLLDRTGLSGPMRAAGVLLCLFGLLIFSFRVTFSGLSENGANIHDPLVEGFIVSFTVASALGVVLILLQRRDEWFVFEALAVAAATALPLLVLYRPVDRGLDVFDFRATEMKFALAANALIVLITLCAILVGYQRQQLWLARTGITFAVIELVIRFFDLEWTRLSRSLVITVTGLLLIALAALLARRRTAP